MFSTIAELKRMSTVLNAVQEEPVVITKHGKPVGILVKTSSKDLTNNLNSLAAFYVGISPKPLFPSAATGNEQKMVDVSE